MLFEHEGAWHAHEQLGGIVMVNDEPGGYDTFVEEATGDRLARPRPLREGDELTVPGQTFVFRHELQRLNRNPELEAAILDHPEDEGCRRVYRDFLLDRGDAMGDASPLAAEWLEVLDARDAFVRVARIRGGFGAIPDTVLSALKSLAEHPSARFLERLEVDCLTWRTENPLEPAVELLEAARWSTTLPRLKARPRECAVVCHRPRLQPEGDFERLGIAQRNHAWSIEGGTTQITFFTGLRFDTQMAMRVLVNGRLVIGTLNLRDRDELHIERAGGMEMATFRAQTDPL
jgi:uncharacterized protein (TIGR02996 family)